MSPNHLEAVVEPVRHTVQVNNPFTFCCGMKNTVLLLSFTGIIENKKVWKADICCS